MQKLFSNGKILMAPAGTELDEVISKLVENAKENYSKEIVFDFAKEPFPHYIIPTDVSFDEIREFCYPDITLEFKVVGNEVTEYHSNQLKEIKYTFTPEEKLELADRLCEFEKMREEQEETKKAETKRLADIVKNTETNISIIASKYREGYEWRNVDTILAFDFANKQRIYMDPGTHVVLHVEELKAEDYQLQLNLDSLTTPVEEKNEEQVTDEEIFK